MTPKQFSARYTLTLTLLAVLSCSAVQAQTPVSLEERTVLGGQVSLLVPKSFKPMSEASLELKYPAEQRPTEVLSNEQGSVNLAFNYTQDALKPNEVAEAYPTIDELFRNLYPSARWNRSEVVSRGGRDYFVMDLWTPAVDTEIRNVIIGTSAEGRFLLATFNVTRELEGAWGNVGEKIMSSLRVLD